MNKKILLLIILLLSLVALSQSPQAFKYQAIARNNLGIELANANLNVRVSIHNLTLGGTIVYQETFSVITNQFGLFNLNIGQGTVTTGTFSAIAWGAGNKFMEQEIDFGTGYQSMGTSQLLSVPYALYAENSGTTNGWSLTGNTGTVDTVNFMGTTDNKPLNFRVNNQKAGRIDNSLGNTFFGMQAGAKTTGIWNTANGFGALYSNITGNDNTATGTYALLNNTTGHQNTANGVSALIFNTTGNYNTANGRSSLVHNITGNNNTATGYATLFQNTIANGNTANGSDALHSNTTGNSNVAVGISALYHNMSRSNLIAIGDSALYNNGVGATLNIEAINNTAIGSKALYGNTTGSSNTANGLRSLFSNTIGYENTANGVRALFSNTKGWDNAANGVEALYSNTGGAWNVANGVWALYSNTNGNANTANGGMALYSNNTGYNNTANGVAALRQNTSGYLNSANGSSALIFNSTGSRNTANGADALFNNTTGNFNTALGSSADVASGSLTNATAIGANAKVSASNNMVFGDSNVIGWGFGVTASPGKAMQVGTNTSNGNGAFLSTGGTWTNGSSLTYKDNITSLDGNEILKKVSQLKVARWKYKETNEYHIGPFAEQFYELFNTGNDDKHISTIDPSGIALLAIQQLIKENKEMKKEIEELKSQIKK